MDKATIIKKTKVDDLKELQKLGKQTFYETFASTNTKEDMEKYLAENFSERQMVKELTNPHSAFYFAIVDNKTVGYLKVNWLDAQSEQQEEHAFEIERIYVLEKLHGKSIGQLLYGKALSLAKQQKAKYLWLGVWEHNPRAIRFYEKNGFVAFDKHVFIVGTDKQTDILMKLTL